MNVENKLKDIIINISGKNVTGESINDNTVLTNDFNFDSISIISLIIEIESVFNIEIEDDDLDIEKLTVYKSLYELISSKLKIE